MEENTLLDELKVRREQAISNWTRWPITVTELLDAYNAGERNFARASLRNASLRNASLDDASLDGASLRNASLVGASLVGASLPEGYHILHIGPIGSRRDYAAAVIESGGERYVTTGCFKGSLDEFIAAVARKPEGDTHRTDYETIVIPAFRLFFAKWPVLTEVLADEEARETREEVVTEQASSQSDIPF